VRHWHRRRRPDALLSAQAPQAPRRPAAAQDLNLVNGRIHTLDARNSVVSAVAIRNGRIASVGNNAPPRTANTRVIDLRGRTVVPGLIEAHVHIVSLANRPGYHTILENTDVDSRDPGSARRAPQERARGPVDHVDGRLAPEPVGRASHPTLKELDEAVPDRPVLLYERFTGPRAPTAWQEVLRRARRRAPVHPGIKKSPSRQRRDRRGGFAGGGPSASALFPSAPAADVRGQEAQHDRRDAYSAAVG
jgi:predicted amidohydrolase YtcJ